MTAADAKGHLAKAYAAGGTPMFRGLIPGMTDEVWSLGPQWFVVPSVPPGCEPALELALRVRRQAILEGTCAECGAVPTTEGPPFEQPEGGWPVIAAATFRHSFRCPGRDEATQALPAAHHERQAALSDGERYELAQTGIREMVRSLQNGAGVPLDPEFGLPFAEKLLDRLLNPSDGSGSICDHLLADQNQTWNVLIAEGRWRCNQCNEYFKNHVMTTQDSPYLGMVEEHTCDICRRYAPSTLEPMMIRSGLFVMTGGACSCCRQDYASTSIDAVTGYES